MADAWELLVHVVTTTVLVVRATVRLVRTLCGQAESAGKACWRWLKDVVGAVLDG
jgi:hypothetical protein